MPDCGSQRGISMRAIIDAGTVVASLASRILGRTSAETLRDLDGNVIVEAGAMIVEEHMPAITAAGIQEVKIRSVLTCEAKNGVCGLCYGRDLARGTPVNHRRGGRRHRRPVDRRAGHPAHHAHLPHRRRGAARGPVVHRVELRRRGEDPQPQPRPQLRTAI